MTERTHGRRRWLVLATGALVGLIAGTLLAPRPPQLSAEVGGDAELAADARSAAGDPMGLERLVVARVADGEIVTAALGGGRPEQRFEIGSIAKVLTGMLLADLAAEGVVSLDEPRCRHCCPARRSPIPTSPQSPSSGWPPTTPDCRG
ncbi:hypothetical protein BH23ACT8_BH23ACT8_21100 [soil metagenome]